MLKKIQFFLSFSFCYNTIWIAVLGFGVTGDFGVGRQLFGVGYRLLLLTAFP